MRSLAIPRSKLLKNVVLYQKQRVFLSVLNTEVKILLLKLVIKIRSLKLSRKYSLLINLSLPA